MIHRTKTSYHKVITEQCEIFGDGDREGVGCSSGETAIPEVESKNKTLRKSWIRDPIPVPGPTYTNEPPGRVRASLRTVLGVE